MAQQQQFQLCGKFKKTDTFNRWLAGEFREAAKSFNYVAVCNDRDVFGNDADELRLKVSAQITESRRMAYIQEHGSEPLAIFPFPARDVPIQYIAEEPPPVMATEKPAYENRIAAFIEEAGKWQKYIKTAAPQP